MANREVQRYYAAWNPGANRGTIFFRFSASEKTKWFTENPAEFGAALQLLSSSENVFVDHQGTVSTGIAEDIDD